VKLPLQITWQSVDQSDAVEAAIRAKADKLDQYYDRIMSCRVVVEAPHQHHHKGKLYQINIDVTVPGGEIVVKRNPDQHAAHEDIYVAIRDAFDAAKRQLQNYARKQRPQNVKTHEPQPFARVLRTFPDDGYGFLGTPDGREVYFHRNSVVGADFEGLEPGTEVTYVEEMGEEGPQASRVSGPLSKH